MEQVLTNEGSMIVRYYDEVSSSCIPSIALYIAVQRAHVPDWSIGETL